MTNKDLLTLEREKQERNCDRHLLQCSILRSLEELGEYTVPDYAKEFKGGNETYSIEYVILGMMNNLKQEHETDPRWTAIAKTHFEEGFMAWRKSFQKKDVK